MVWDTFLDQIIYFTSVTVPDGAAIGAIPVPMWFAEQEHYVFGDTNANGLRDLGEQGIPDQNINLRFRAGTRRRPQTCSVWSAGWSCFGSAGCE